MGAQTEIDELNGELNSLKQNQSSLQDQIDKLNDQIKAQSIEECIEKFPELDNTQKPSLPDTSKFTSAQFGGFGVGMIVAGILIGIILISLLKKKFDATNNTSAPNDDDYHSDVEMARSISHDSDNHQDKHSSES